jgi:multidrug efflux pump subunit AcrA (membrane-fusion protein)
MGCAAPPHPHFSSIIMASSRLIPITLAAVLLVAGGGGYYYFQRARTAEQPPAYNTTTIASGQIRQLVTAPDNSTRCSQSTSAAKSPAWSSSSTPISIRW